MAPDIDTTTTNTNTTSATSAAAAAVSMSNIQEKLKLSTQEYQALRAQFNKLIIKNQNLESQLTQNKSIKHEFDLISNPTIQADVKKPTQSSNSVDPKGFVIYKSIANVLIKQDLQESKSNVNRRIEFLTNQISKLESQILSIQTKMNKSKSTIHELQQESILSNQISSQPPTQQLSNTHLLST